MRILLAPTLLVVHLALALQDHRVMCLLKVGARPEGCIAALPNGVSLRDLLRWPPAGGRASYYFLP
jgi:hypothetical protein